tara:strand:+ start:161 stop:346 length:186 start_codon:yes stop_codon:yes gene_type:complete
MEFFKAVLEVKTRKSWHERILYIRAEDAIGAYTITRKIRGAALKVLKPISYEDYMNGVKNK